MLQIVNQAEEKQCSSSRTRRERERCKKTDGMNCRKYVTIDAKMLFSFKCTEARQFIFVFGMESNVIKKKK